MFNFVNNILFCFRGNNFNILPNTCVVIQLLHYPQGKFTERVKRLHYHKLYQIDNVFLYPSVRDQMYINLQQNVMKLKYDRNSIKLSYYYGRLLSHPKNVCHSLKCYRQNLTLPVYHTNSYHLEVIYPTNVIYICIPENRSSYLSNWTQCGQNNIFLLSHKK